MIPNIAMDWTVWDWDQAEVGSVSIQTAEGTGLGVEAISVEHGVLGAGVKGVGAWGRDIGNSSGVDILQGDTGQRTGFG